MSGRGFPLFSPPCSSGSLSATHMSASIAQWVLPPPLHCLPQLQHPVIHFQTTVTTPDKSGSQMSIKATESQMLEWPGILIDKILRILILILILSNTNTNSKNTKYSTKNHL